MFITSKYFLIFVVISHNVLDWRHSASPDKGLRSKTRSVGLRGTGEKLHVNSSKILSEVKYRIP